MILAASGMCEGGRILHHLRHHGPDRRNIVLFVGYQAEHTLGRRILEGADTMKVYGERVALNAEVERINGLSAHADRRGLLRYARRLDHPPKQVFLVHGDEDRVAALGAYFAENGIPMGRMEFSGVVLDGNMYTQLAGYQFVNFPIYVTLLTLAAAVYPAIFASRIVPTRALQRAL